MFSSGLYKTVEQILAAIPTPKSGIVFESLEKCKIVGGRQIYKNGKGKKLRFYIWDAMHGHWEVYNKKGINIHSKTNDGNILQEFPSGASRQRLTL